MAVTVRGTDILFNDGSTQSTAASTPSTTFGAVGTYAVLMMGTNQNVATGGSIAGSSLRYNHNVVYPFSSKQYGPSYTAPSYNGGGTSLSGTWRKMSTSQDYIVSTVSGQYGTEYTAQYGQALYVRIS